MGVRQAPTSGQGAYATALYYDHTDPQWDIGCLWIEERIFEDIHGMPPDFITTVSVESLNPCF
jgi:hypothetical protein